MTLRSRLLLTLSGVILLLVLPAAYGVSQLQRLRAVVEQFEYLHAADIRAMADIRVHLAEYNRYQQNYVSFPDDEVHREGAQRELGMIQTQLTFLQESFPEAIQPTRRLVDSLHSVTRQVDSLVATGRRQQATNAFNQRAKPIVDSTRAAIYDIAGAINDRGEQQVLEAQRVSAAGAQTTMLAVLIALFLTIVVSLWTTNALTRPLRRLSDATAAVADGDFMAPEDLPYERGDEIGYLSRAFGSMTQRLAELDRLKAEFVSLASHELKTPINVIAGYSELLTEGLYGEMDERQVEVLMLVQEQTRALTRLVNQLLDLSRFEAGGLRIEPQPVDVAELLAQVEGSFRALATQKQITFTVEVDSSMPDRVTLDPDRIRHEVLGNLLSNAFKFTGTGGEVSVRAWSRNGSVHLEVADTGTGIPEDQLDHIFEKYYQVGSAAKAKGSGLGLAIAKHVTEAHGGRIEASSVVNQGTRFHLVLPQVPGQSPAGAASPA